MIIKINRLFQKNIKHKVIYKNVISLFILQGSDYILPLILLPYLVRTLGLEYFGILAFATATISFFRGIVSYGFDLSGTKQIAMNKDNQGNIVEIFSSILIVKLLLAILSLIILIPLLLYVDKIQMHWEVFAFTFLIVIGDIIFPIWFFQGMEKMSFITTLRITYKVFFVISVIAFISTPEKYYLVPLFDAIGAFFVGIVALYFVKTRFNVEFLMPTFNQVVFQFKNGWHIFISNIAVLFYTSINTFTLGLLTDTKNVGLYALAEKIYMALRGLSGPITQALFPFLSNQYRQNKDLYYMIVKKLSFYYFFILFILTIISYLFSSELIQIVSGRTVLEATYILEILSTSLPFAIGGFFSSLLVIKSCSNLLSKITIYTMILNLLLLYPIIYMFGIYGLAWQFVIVQFFQASLQLKYNFEIYKG